MFWIVLYDPIIIREAQQIRISGVDYYFFSFDVTSVWTSMTAMWFFFVCALTLVLKSGLVLLCCLWFIWFLSNWAAFNTLRCE